MFLIVCFFLFQNAQLIQETLSRRSNKLSQFKLNRQPLPILIGKWGAISNAYVSVEDVLYEVESGERAIDVCFKAFFALGSKYPLESRPLWLLIQRAVYKLKLPADSSISGAQYAVLDLFDVSL